jgi:hypothetical protein
MGYACYETPLGDAGYGVEDTCHQDGCTESIDRGLAYLCGDQPGRPGEHGCGRWFCGENLFGLPDAVAEEGILGGGMCKACVDSYYEERPEEREREEETFRRRVELLRASGAPGF